MGCAPAGRPLHRPRHGRRPGPPGAWRVAPGRRTAQRTELPDAHHAPRGLPDTAGRRARHRPCHSVAAGWRSTGGAPWRRGAVVTRTDPRSRGWIRGSMTPRSRGSGSVVPRSRGSRELGFERCPPAVASVRARAITCIAWPKCFIRTAPRPGRGSAGPLCGSPRGRILTYLSPGGPCWAPTGPRPPRRSSSYRHTPAAGTTGGRPRGCGCSRSQMPEGSDASPSHAMLTPRGRVWGHVARREGVGSPVDHVDHDAVGN